MTSQLAFLLLHLLALVPRPLAQWLGRRLGDLQRLGATRGYQVTLENLRLCYPGMSDEQLLSLAASSLRDAGQTALETPSVWLASPHRLRRWIGSVTNEAALEAAEARGRGVLILLPHHGNWELMNMFLATRSHTTALYHPPRQRWLQPVMAQVREHFGNELVSTNRRGITRLYRALGEGRTVTVLPDQVPANGRFSPFFGQAALTDTLSSRLAQKTGATALLTTVLRRDDGRFDVKFTEALPGFYSNDLDESLACLNNMIESAVRAAPEQYQWEYKRFRERPEGEPKLYRFGKAGMKH